MPWVSNDDFKSSLFLGESPKTRDKNRNENTSKNNNHNNSNNENNNNITLSPIIINNFSKEGRENYSKKLNKSIFQPDKIPSIQGEWVEVGSFTLGIDSPRDHLLIHGSIPWFSENPVSIGIEVFENGCSVFKSFDGNGSKNGFRISNFTFFVQNPPLGFTIYELKINCNHGKLNITRPIVFIGKIN